MEGRTYCGNCGIALDALGGCGVCKPGKADAANSPALGRCHVELLITAAGLRREAWVPVEGHYPTDADPVRNLRAVQAMLAEACGVDRVRLRWRPSGLADGPVEDINAGAAGAASLGAHNEAGYVYLMQVVTGGGVFAIAQPEWLADGTAVWPLTGKGTATAQPVIAYVASAPHGQPLAIGTGQVLADVDEGAVVAWCRIPPGGGYAHPIAQRLALEQHRIENG